MAKKPKVGDNTVDDPTTAPVTDPTTAPAVPAAVEAEAPMPEQSAQVAVDAAAGDLAKAKAALKAAEDAHAAAVEAAKPAILPYDADHPTVLTEDRGEMDAPDLVGQTADGHVFRVSLPDRSVYEHSADVTILGKDGKPFQRWMFRRVK